MVFFHLFPLNLIFIRDLWLYHVLFVRWPFLRELRCAAMGDSWHQLLWMNTWCGHNGIALRWAQWHGTEAGIWVSVFI